MTALREKLARALAASNGQDPDEVIIRAPAAMLRWQAYENDADAILATIEESGMVIVPREATEEMLGDGWNETPSDWIGGLRDLAYVWEAMLAAAPKEPTS